MFKRGVYKAAHFQQTVKGGKCSKDKKWFLYKEAWKIANYRTKGCLLPSCKISVQLKTYQ